MNTEIYMTYIEERLFVLQHRVILRSSLNILGLNTRSEDLYKGLFNIIFDYNLLNLNNEKSNAEAVDLKDEYSRIIVQVTSTASRQKIESTLEKNALAAYSNYTQKFIFIGKSASNLINKTYSNPYEINFNPKEDIYDVDRLLKEISQLNIDKMKEVYIYLEKHLELPTTANNKVNTLLPKIILILSDLDLESQVVDIVDVKAFEIEKKIYFNDLYLVQAIIREFAPFHVAVSKIYEELNSTGKNTALSIINKIRNVYLKLAKTIDNNDDLFFAIIKELKIEMKKNYLVVHSDIFEEELEMCIEIIVVDAFIKCKIFKKPEV